MDFFSSNGQQFMQQFAMSTQPTGSAMAFGTIVSKTLNQKEAEKFLQI
jgi:hypothetical protein